LPKVTAVFPPGCLLDHDRVDGKFMMDVNYRYSKTLLHWCQRKNIPYIYASSASVYGMGKQGFLEVPASEKPLNMYAYSKFLFDQYVRRQKISSQVVGLRYFNVYGRGSSTRAAWRAPRSLQQPAQDRRRMPVVRGQRWIRRR